MEINVAAFAISAFGAGLFILIVRVMPLLYVRTVGDDVWEHLLLIKHFRRLRRIPTSIPEYYPCNEYYYPPLSYILGSLISNRMLERKGCLASAMLEGIVGACLGAAIWYLTRSYQAVSLGIIFYAFTPLLATNGLDWNPRTLGAGLAGLGLAAVAILPENYGWLVGGSLFILTALTHRMSSQVIWLIALILSVIFQSPQWIASALMGEVGAALLCPRLYFRIRRSHFQMLRIYFFTFKERPTEPRLDIKRNLMRILIYCTGPVGVLIMSVLIAITASALKDWQLQLAWINGISIMLAFSTSIIKDLLFLGEGERYPMNAAVPTAIFFATAIFFMPSGSVSFWLLIAGVLSGQVAGWFIALRQAAFASKQAVDVSQDKMCEIASVCKRLGLSGRFLCLPYRLNRRFAYEGLECFQLTPGAILDLPKHISKHPFSTLLGHDLDESSELVYTILEVLDIQNAIVYLPGAKPLSHLHLVTKTDKWAIYSGKKGAQGNESIKHIASR